MEITLRLKGHERVAVAAALAEVRADVQFGLIRGTLAAELPLRVGARATWSNFAIAITSCEEGRTGDTVVGWVERGPLTGYSTWREVFEPYFTNLKYLDETYCLIDRRRKALLVSSGNSETHGPLNGVNLLEFEILMPAPGRSRDVGSMTEWTDGLKDVTLVKTEFTWLGKFNRTFDGQLAR